MEQIKKQVRDKMDARLKGLAEELKKIRTGKAQSFMLDSVKVNYYGSPTPLSQTANITCPDARSFLIAPWDTSMLKEIEAAIVKSDVGMTPINDGKVIRLKMPEVTEERRKELVKTVKKVVEDARIALRQVRKEANDAVKEALKAKTISEDQNKALLEEVQKITDDYMKKVDQTAADKEKDLLTL